MTGLITEENVGTPLILRPWRFEVRWKDASGMEHRYGWTTSQDGGQVLADAAAVPGAKSARVVDLDEELKPPC